MQYLLGLIGEEPNFEEISPDEMQATIDLMDKYNQELKDAGAMIYGAGLREQAQARDMRLELLNVNEHLRELFRITHLDSVFKIRCGVEFLQIPASARHRPMAA